MNKNIYLIILIVSLVSCKSKNIIYYKAPLYHIIIKKNTKQFIYYTPRLFYSVAWGAFHYDSLKGYYITENNVLKDYIEYKIGADSDETDSVKIEFISNIRFDYRPYISISFSDSSFVNVDCFKHTQSTASFMIAKSTIKNIKEFKIISSIQNSTSLRINYELPSNDYSSLTIKLILPKKYIEYDFSYYPSNFIFSDLYNKKAVAYLKKDSSKIKFHRMRRKSLYTAPKRLKELTNDIW